MARKGQPTFNNLIDDFSGGSMTTLSDARLGRKTKNHKFAQEATNLIQVEDGIWEGPRPGTGYYGTEVPGTGIDHSAEFTKEDKTRELIVISNDGKGYKSADDGRNWTEVTGATWTPGKQFVSIHFKNQLWITNGFDPLVYYDGTNFNDFTAIDDPTDAPNVTLGAGLSAGSYVYYLRYVANNSVGNTNPSPAVTISVDKPIEQWVLDSNEYIDIDVTAVTGAESYDFYLDQIESGPYGHIGGSATLDFRYFGDPPNTFQQAPDDNTTSAPKVSSMELSGNRMWATKDKDNPWRVYGTGTSQYLGYFSPFYGGFDADLERGGKYYPTVVVHYRTGKGDPIATVLCSSADGSGTIFQIELTTTTVGDVNIVIPIAYKLVGSTGSDAVGSVTKFGDNVAFLNKKAVNFLRNKEQLFNVLATDDMTAPIRDKFESTNKLAIEKAIGYWRSPILYFSIAVGGDENDTTFVWDDERRNWTWGWTIGFKQIMEYTDTNGVTRLLGIRVNDTKLIEISDNYLSDLGQPIVAQYVGPLIPIDPTDPRVLSKRNETIFEIGELRGSVTCTVLGRTRKSELSELGSKEVESTFSNSGIGDDLFSDVLFSDTGDLPKTFSSSSIKKSVRITKKLYAIKYRVKSNGVNNKWRLLSVMTEGRKVFKKSPSEWKR
ncbi:MAG: hypothetical protein HY865_22630 [Chloroflexi bacterium]|nr:hypothetical protein [Chloroflexota bacterium]